MKLRWPWLLFRRRPPAPPPDPDAWTDDLVRQAVWAVVAAACLRFARAFAGMQDASTKIGTAICWFGDYIDDDETVFWAAFRQLHGAAWALIWTGPILPEAAV